MKTVTVEKNIYRRGPTSFQVKMQVGACIINETFETLNQAQDFRDSKRIRKNCDPDYQKIVGARLKKREYFENTLASMLTRYLEEFTVKKTNFEAEQYRVGVIQKSTLGKLPFYYVGGKELQAFLQTLVCSESTKLKYVAVISHLYNVARTHWACNVDNPATQIVKPKAAPGRERRVYSDEFEFLIKVLNDPLRRNRDLVDLAKIAVRTPVREMELLTLTWQHVNLEQGTLLITSQYSKNKKARTVPLYPDIVELLRVRYRQANNTERVFQTSQSALVQAWRRAIQRGRGEYLNSCRSLGIPPKEYFLVDLHFHDLRHEAISRLFEETDLRDFEISQIAGHSSLNTTKLYTHLRANNLVARFKTCHKSTKTVSNRQPMEGFVD